VGEDLNVFVVCWVQLAGVEGRVVVRLEFEEGLIWWVVGM